MTESEMNAALVYYYERTAYLSEVTTTLFIVIGVLALLLVLFIALFFVSHQERGRLKEELAQQADPAHQLARIHDLGEAGRREVRRLAQEAHHEMQHVMLRAGGR